MTGDGRPRVTILIPADDPQAGETTSDPSAPRVEVGGTGEAARGGFPAARFGEVIRRLPRYLRLAWALAGEPSLPRSRKAGVLAAAAYLASPVDLIPGIIPVVGQLDDVAVTVLALRAALRALDAPTRQRLLAESGLAQEDLDRDLQTAGLAALWLAHQGVRLTRRLLRLAATAGVAVGRRGGRVAAGAAAEAAKAGGRAVPRVAGGAARATASVGRAGAGVAGRGVSAAGRAAGGAGRRIGGVVRRGPRSEEPGPAI